VPTFPNARYLFGRTEAEHWDPRRHPDSDDPHRRIAWADSVLPVLEAGQAELIDTPYAIDDTLLVEAAPGHTAGHVLLKLRTPDGGGVFCGDVIHHPLQLVAPHWNSRFCECPDDARTTRRRVLEHCADSGSWLLPTHFGAPHVVLVDAVGAVPTFRAPDDD
jgi:glyoxylase-like metal-dependent hydrolase (beta-lactamase superfamily II)